MKIKKIFKKLSDIKDEINKRMIVKGYKIKLKYASSKDPNLQNGNRFFSRKK